MNETVKNLVSKAIDTIRVLATDAVQKAQSGHPGTAMYLAPMGHILWTQAMNYSPKNHKWPNRDRFILSAGHACILQYSFLYLTRYDVSMDDLKNFRQLHSTAGHPEHDLLDGVEVTTGPPGQGFANGARFAITKKSLASRFNKTGFDIFDYNLFVICNDGNMMEGVIAEAASLVGNRKIGNMIYLYDDNHISIEGDTDITFRDDTAKRFESYGWYVQELEDGNDTEAISQAIEKAKKEADRPSLIKVRTHIAYGSPNKQDTAEAHGAPLGDKEVKLVKENFDFDPEEKFNVEDDVLDYYRQIGNRGDQHQLNKQI